MEKILSRVQQKEFLELIEETNPPSSGASIHWPTLVLRFLMKYGDTDTRLDWVEGSLPAEHGIANMLHLESNVLHTYGFPEYEVKDLTFANFQNKFFKELHESSYFHFWVSHLPIISSRFPKIFPNCQQIRFIHTDGWIVHCLSKGKMEWVRCYPEFSNEDLLGDSVDFDVDVLFEKKAFLREMARLYEYFALPNFDQKALTTFHRHYMRIHDVVV